MKRRRIILLLSVVALIGSVFLVSNAGEAIVEYRPDVYVDGVKLELDVQPQHFGFTYMMIPLRSVAEHLGAEYSWDVDTNEITMLTEKGTILLTVGSNRLIRNEETIVMWIPIRVIEGRAAIAYRNLADCFNVHSTWDRENNRVLIYTDNSLYNVMNKQEITIGINNGFVPFGFTDEIGQYIGFDIDLAQEAANRLGVGLNIKSIDWSVKHEELSNRNVDMLWGGLVATDEHEQYMLFTESYAIDGYVLVAKVDSNIVTRDQLEKARLGYSPSVGYFNLIDDVNAVNDNIELNLRAFNDQEALLQALDNGDIDAFFARKIDVQYNLIRGSEEYKLLRFLFDKEELAVAFNIKDIYLRDAIQETIDEMKNDGTYNEILSSWFGTERIDHIAFDSNRDIVYNGVTYYHHYFELGRPTNRWVAGNIGRNLGGLSHWGDDRRFFHFGLMFRGGVFENESRSGTTGLRTSLGEWYDMYLRSDIEVPELTADNIDSIELVRSQLSWDFVADDSGATDRDVINEFMNLLLSSESETISADLAVKTILLYSNSMPGFFYPISIFEENGLYYLQYNQKYILIHEELLYKLDTLD